MDPQTDQGAAQPVWALARSQHWVLAREQLLALGVHPDAIKHRVATGRLHPVHAGVYAVGRRELSREGQLMAAVLACGQGAMLSHRSAAELWGIAGRAAFEVTVPAVRKPRRPGIRVHRRVLDPAHTTRRRNIPITSITCTLVDLAPYLSKDHLERAVNEADRLDLINPEQLRKALEGFAGHLGVAKLRTLLDRLTFTLTDSALERRFKPIARAAGLPLPKTRTWVNGFLVDFYWPDLGLVVETDGLRYHRTPSQQTKALRRDQAHYASGLLPLRFSHAQIRWEPDYVAEMLRRAVNRRSFTGPR